jgi:hypothetical protein
MYSCPRPECETGSASRIEVEVLAKSYGLTGATRFTNLLDAAGVAKTAREPGGSDFTERGGRVELQVPLFDFGEVRMHEAEATYMQAVNRLVAHAVNVRSQAREVYQAYRSAYDIAQHYHRDVLPLRKIISDEMLLRYNAMQVDVFALLAEARQRIASNTAAIAADRDFWLAEADLRAVVSAGPAARHPSHHSCARRGHPPPATIDRGQPMNLSRRDGEAVGGGDAWSRPRSVAAPRPRGFRKPRSGRWRRRSRRSLPPLARPIARW